jgi:hypothetical protein
MAELNTHTGSCHCGKVRFEVKADLAGAVACNCSICSKAGYLLAFVPKDQFTLVSGQDGLTDYQFGKKNIHHLFCSTCGMHPYGHGIGPGGTEMFAVNVRCVDGADPEALKITRFDGKSL